MRARVQWAKALFMNSFWCVIKPFVHATGFSQWLMTNLSERRIHSAFENFAWMVVLLHDRNFFGSTGMLPYRNYSPFATRYSPPFSARQEPCFPDLSTD